MKMKKIIKTTTMIILTIIFSVKTIFASEVQKKYTLTKITLIGNTRVTERKIRELVSVQEGMKLTESELEFRSRMSKAKMQNSGLFMFVDINFQTHEDGYCDMMISMGENVILLDMFALEDGGFTRFSSLSENAPDFGFMVGSKTQAFYLRFPYLWNTPVNLATTIAHHSYSMTLNPLNEYAYEAASGRAALDMAILPDWKIKIPAVYRYNIKGDSHFASTGDLSTGLETLIDFSHFKDVIYTGFDIQAAITQGIVSFPCTMVFAGANVYIKPAKWEEVILRGRYRSVLSGNVPDYLLYRIDNEYQIRGQIANHYFGRSSVVLNAENWLRDIFVSPSAVTNIHFSLITFVDLGTAGDQIAPIGIKDWNLSVGGALSVEFSAPLNLALQAGYAQELWQNTGGQFYVKIGYEYRKGNFFE